MPGWIFWALESVSVLCALHLWTRAPGGTAKKVLWSFAVMIPVMGPLAYGAIYEVPSEQDDDARAGDSNTDGVDD